MSKNNVFAMKILDILNIPSIQPDTEQTGWIVHRWLKVSGRFAKMLICLSLLCAIQRKRLQYLHSP